MFLSAVLLKPAKNKPSPLNSLANITCKELHSVATNYFVKKKKRNFWTFCLPQNILSLFFLMTNKQKNFCLGGLRLGLGIHY